jgi:hypothetical protein
MQYLHYIEHMRALNSAENPTTLDSTNPSSPSFPQRESGKLGLPCESHRNLRTRRHVRSRRR